MWSCAMSEYGADIDIGSHVPCDVGAISRATDRLASKATVHTRSP